MGKIITIASQKGGVGKTTTALNLGYSLSRFGNSVLIVDGDPQGGIAISTNLSKVTTSGLMDLLKGKCTVKDIVKNTKDRTMAIVGIGSLNPEDVLLLEEEANNGNLGRAIASLQNSFDYVFIDAPAGVGSIVNAIFSVSQSIILALQCRALALKTMPMFLKTLQFSQKNNPALLLEGVVITMMNKQNLAEVQLFQEMQQVLPSDVFFKTKIPVNNLFEKASLKGIPVALLKGGQNAARPYLDLAMELKERELVQQTEGEDDDVEGLF